MKKRALITGAAGQDGSYLAELLLIEGYEVHGLIRHASTDRPLDNICEIASSIDIIEGDITDAGAMAKLVSLIKPHEIYNLAAQSHVGASFQLPVLTLRSSGVSVVNLLEAIRASGFNSKLYQASTSEMFGNVGGLMNEMSELKPVSPYGCAKLMAHHMCRVYRDAYNMFVCSGILFNHESPRRGPNFVTRKVCRAAAAIAAGFSKDKLKLGNLDAARDWGHAKDYVRGMHMMMQHSLPDDYVLATGHSHSVRELCSVAFSHVGLEYEDHVVIDPSLFRPIDVEALRGDAGKAWQTLGWVPTTKFEELIHEMVDAEMVGP